MKIKKGEKWIKRKKERQILQEYKLIQVNIDTSGNPKGKRLNEKKQGDIMACGQKSKVCQARDRGTGQQ